MACSVSLHHPTFFPLGNGNHSLGNQELRRRVQCCKREYRTLRTDAAKQAFSMDIVRAWKNDGRFFFHRDDRSPSSSSLGAVITYRPADDGTARRAVRAKLTGSCPVSLGGPSMQRASKRGATICPTSRLHHPSSNNTSTNPGRVTPLSAGEEPPGSPIDEDGAAAATAPCPSPWQHSISPGDNTTPFLPRTTSSSVCTHQDVPVLVASSSSNGRIRKNSLEDLTLANNVVVPLFLRLERPPPQQEQRWWIDAARTAAATDDPTTAVHVDPSNPIASCYWMWRLGPK
jgi:hypothetical protein